MSSQLPSGYQFQPGSGLDKALLLKFMRLTYQELFPEQNFFHLSETVEQYFSKDTPLWWVEFLEKENFPTQNQKVACLWLGNAVDQVYGDRHAHIFLLYVKPEHRRQGIGKALVSHAEDWARARGDRKMGLQVFQVNQPALHLYQQLGYQTHSLWMIKEL